MEEGDPIRIITMLAALIAAILAGEALRKRHGASASHVFILAWALNVFCFYLAYFMTGRWDVSPEFRVVISNWPPIVWAHGALSIMMLQIARRVATAGHREL